MLPLVWRGPRWSKHACLNPLLHRNGHTLQSRDIYDECSVSVLDRGVVVKKEIDTVLMSGASAILKKVHAWSHITAQLFQIKTVLSTVTSIV